MIYPKIDTLFNRDPKTFKVNELEIRRPEFLIPNIWDVTEKIHGMNIRVYYQKGESTIPFVQYFGRGEKAQIPKLLNQYLPETFTVEVMQKAFTPEKFPVRGENSFTVVLFGEGYGNQIQKGGGDYTTDVSVSFRLFDVFVYDSANPLGGWWLELDNITDIARNLGIKTVPYLGPMHIDEIVDMVKDEDMMVSSIEGSVETKMSEGVVCRSSPLLFMRNGKRLMWKLKRKDFEQ